MCEGVLLCYYLKGNSTTGNGVCRGVGGVWCTIKEIKTNLEQKNINNY